MEKIVELIFARNTDEISKLIKSGDYDVNSFVSLDRTALALAAACNYIDVMECLIRNGADVNLNNGGDLGYTPIEEAARENKLEAITLLIKNKAEIDKGNTINTNALIGACIGAHIKAIKLLLKNGSNINHSDNSEQTALHYLCRYAMGWGGGTYFETVNGVTRQIVNTRFKQHTDVFNLLLKEGADVNKETSYGYTPLHLAAETNAHTFISPLVKKGANVNVQNSKGFSPLHAASDRGNLAACKELIKNGANINSVDLDGFTPLLGAVSSQNSELVKLFLKKGAVKDIKAKVSYGNVSAGDDAISLAEKLGDKTLSKLLK
jgi:ankyrin repeat protein